MTTAYNIGLAIAGPLFAALLVVGISVALDLLLLGDSLVDGSPPRIRQRVISCSGCSSALSALGLVAWVASRNVNINRFSIHALYRNRLVRAYLGATAPKAQPRQIHRFRCRRQFPRAQLWPPKPPKHDLPQHVQSVPRGQYHAQRGEDRAAGLAAAQGGIVHGEPAAFRRGL